MYSLIKYGFSVFITYSTDAAFFSIGFFMFLSGDINGKGWAKYITSFVYSISSFGLNYLQSC